jgi:hypothetical protein
MAPEKVRPGRKSAPGHFVYDISLIPTAMRPWLTATPVNRFNDVRATSLVQPAGDDVLGW